MKFVTTYYVQTRSAKTGAISKPKIVSREHARREIAKGMLPSQSLGYGIRVWETAHGVRVSLTVGSV